LGKAKGQASSGLSNPDGKIKEEGSQDKDQRANLNK